MEEDKARLERKINKYMNYNGTKAGKQPESIGTTASYASEKVRTLHEYLQQIESQSEMSESDFENSGQSFNIPNTNKWSPSGNINSKAAIQKLSLQKKDKRDIDSGSEQSIEEKWRAELQRSNSELERKCLELESKCSQRESDLEMARLELDEANKTVETLKEFLSKEQQQSIENERRLRDELEKSVREEKDETANTVERYLDMINKLVKDKDELNSMIEPLVQELKEAEEKHSAEIAQLKDKAQKELKANKEAWIAAEKSRKDKWMSEKTNEIKEVTIKGLEPEIERLINKHKVEINRLKDQNTKEILELRERVQQEYEQKFRAQKEKWISETEELVGKERQFRVERTREEVTRVEQNNREERDRIKKELQNELRIVEERRREESESMLDKIRILREQHIEEITAIKSQQHATIETQTQAQKGLLELERNSLKQQQAEWIENQKAKLNEEVQRRTGEIRKRLEKERDLQIEVVINKITEENVDLEKKIAEKFESRIDQINLSHREEIKALKKDLAYFEDQHAKTTLSKNNIQENIQTISKRLLDVQENLNTKQVENDNLKRELQDTKNQLLSQKELQKIHEDNVRKEMRLEVEKLHDQILVLNKTLSQMGAEHSMELEKSEDKHFRAISALEERIRGVILTKDQKIEQLKEKLKQEESKSALQQKLLEKQRRDLIKNPPPQN